MSEALNFDDQPKTDEPTEAVHLFTLNGVEYTIPGKPRVNIALKYLKLARQKSEIEAAMHLLPSMIGEEAFDALTEYDDLTTDMLEKVCMAAAKVTMGGLEKSLGKSNSGPRK